MASRKEPVHLREKPLSSGRSSIYLEINKDGMRRYEFLKLYLTNGKSKADKQADARTWELAEAIRAKRVVELRNSKYGLSDLDKGKTDINAFIHDLSARKNECRKYAYLRVGEFLKDFAKRERIEFNHIDKRFVEDFIQYLKRYKSTKCGRNTLKQSKNLSDGSIYDIVSVFSSIMNAATRSGFITINPLKLVDSSLKPKEVESQREFLTLDELKSMIETDADRYTKTLFLFSCYTGLRYSDIIGLKWEEITGESDNLVIRKRQKKTGGAVDVPLNRMALVLLATRKSTGLVFKKEKERIVVGYHLNKWTKAAGIKKHISFHCARHTFATLLLTKGADIYTVSKLLGHTKISTTQIYAKVVDESRRKAVELLPDFLNEQGNKKE